MRDWERIRAERLDITDWVIHWTRRQDLKVILQCGYLRPSFAPKYNRTLGGKDNTIKGPYPAVCFTDQPLSAFAQSCITLPGRYFPYGIALEKRNLYIYGGRPVIYGDTDLLGRLSDEIKYLWVPYNPIPNESYGNYPLDWTHEREWRARVCRIYFRDYGLTPKHGVPLILPPIYGSDESVLSLPRILVRTLEEVGKLRKVFANLPTYDGQNGFIRRLYNNFAQLSIIPIEFVNEKLSAGDNRWTRLETLPYDEIPLGGS